MKILVIKSSSMGDIIHALPVARDIRRAMPDARIDWVAEESFRDIPRLAPDVEKIHCTAFRRWRRAPFSAQTRGEVAALRRALRAERYDAVLDIQGLIRSAVVAHWTGVPAIGYSRRTVREPIASLFYERKLDLPASLGAVRRYRMAAAEAFGYEIDEAHPVFGLQTAAEPSFDVPPKSVALCPNTSRDEKLWPEESWRALGRRLLARGLASVLYWGGAEEEARCRRIAEGIPGAVVAPRAPLAQVAANLACAAGVVGVDTGLAHLAAALGRPSVGIYVSTPTEILKLVGDGPVRSLGGVGRTPSVDEVDQALAAVMDAAQEH